MITSTGAASACSIPASTSSSSSSNKPSNDDSSTSFHDVMQQQEGSSKDTTQTPTPSPSAKAAAATTPVSTTTTPATTTPDADATTTTKTPPSSTPVPAGSDLAAMIIQAAVLASNAQVAKIPTTPVATTETPAETPAPTTGKDTPPSSTDLATLIAQAAPLLFGAQSGTAKTSTPTISTNTPTANQASKDASTSTSTSTSATTSLAMALASILGSSTPVTGTGKNLSAPTTSKDSTATSSKEKKSTTSDAEGSFLQSGTADTSTSLSTLSLLGTLANASANTSVNQTLTPTTGAKNSSTSPLLSSAISAAGTANVEKEKDMNSTLTTSANDLLSASGANTLVTPKQPDLQVQLASNHDFTDALKQVMHVAQLTQTAESRTPMRVEMTVQTPPGAVVNIYVSQTGGQYRAQLGSNDPVALAWVQTQITSLKSNDLGVEVKWLPPQMETGTPTITTSGSQDANLSWNQGGGQSGYQQPDERQPGQADADENEYAGAGATPFMSTLNSSLGRAS